jgi:thiol-disulfide isomerase/thioredoxin
MRHRLLQSLVHVCLSICVVAAAASARAGDSTPLPPIKTLDGRTLGPLELRGKVVVLSYFASDCPFCMNEAPKLQKLYRDNKDRLIVIAVNVEQRDPSQREKAQQWAKKYKLTHPMTLEFQSLEDLLGKRIGLPMNYVFDKRGVLRRIDVGEMFNEDFDEIARMAQQE